MLMHHSVLVHREGKHPPAAKTACLSSFAAAAAAVMAFHVYLRLLFLWLLHAFPLRPVP